LFLRNNDGSVILTFTGTHFTSEVFDSTKATGFTDPGTGTQTLTPPVLTPGEGFFFNNQNTLFTNTFVGTVHVDALATGTNVVGVTSNLLSAEIAYVYVSSKLPIAGGVHSVLGLPNDGTLDGSIVLIPNIVGGVVHGYNETVFDSTKSTGFTDAGTGTQTLPEPIIPVGGGFLFSNQTGTDFTWIQSL